VNDHTHIGVTSLQRIRNPRQNLIADDGRFPCMSPSVYGEQLERRSSGDSVQAKGIEHRPALPRRDVGRSVGTVAGDGGSDEVCRMT